MNRHRIVLKTSTFPASREIIWKKLQQLSTLQHIVQPFASFTSLDSTNTVVWCEGETFKFHFKLFCLLPFGIHTINVVQFSEAAHVIYTNEVNTHVPIWNHKIYLKPIDKETTEYTDEVEIYAGWKTTFVYIWAKMFYRHRQKKWIKLLESINS